MTASRKKEFLLNIFFYAVICTVLSLFQSINPALSSLCDWISHCRIAASTHTVFMRTFQCSSKLCSIFVLLFVYTVISILLWFATTGFLGELSAIIQNLPDVYRQNIQPLILAASGWLDRLFSAFLPMHMHRSADCLHRWSSPPPPS